MIALMLARLRQRLARTPPAPVRVARCDPEVVDVLTAARRLGCDPESAAEVVSRQTGRTATGLEWHAAGYEGRP